MTRSPFKYPNIRLIFWFLLQCKLLVSEFTYEKVLNENDKPLSIDQATALIQAYVHSEQSIEQILSDNNENSDLLVNSHEWDDWEKSEFVKSNSIDDIASNVLCTAFTCCNITSTESCALNSLQKDKSTLVLPGGDTRCIFSTSTPYAFQVIPGASDKLLFYFQGGGACWTKGSTKIRLCTRNALPKGVNGVYNRDNIDDKFRDYTIVQALYCSGDVWAGNVVRDYDDDAGVPVAQKGIANAQATIDWVIQQQELGYISSTLSELVVMGCSAGSIGAQIWGTTVLSSLKWSRAAIIPDSYAGVFPEGSQGPLIASFGFCTWNGLPASLYEKCVNNAITIQDFMSVFMKTYPNIPFGYIQSKADIIQRSFYSLIALSQNMTALISAEQFYEGVNKVFGTYSKENNNFVTYLVDGRQHCFTPIVAMYTADALGPFDRNSSANTDKTMNDWLSVFPLNEGDKVSTVCAGDLQVNRFISDTLYCSSDVKPKEFVENY